MSTPVGPYTPIVRSDDWLICSGQLGLRDGELVTGFAQQADQALENLQSLLAAEGASLADVVKTTVFLIDLDNYAEMNEIYMAKFDAHGAGNRPARSAFAVAALPLGGEIEIEAWARTPKGP